MPRFRKRPVEVEAEQWFPGRKIQGVVEQDRQLGAIYTHAWMDTLEGPAAVRPGCWIVTGVKGERYPVEDRIFRLTYEECQDRELEPQSLSQTYDHSLEVDLEEETSIIQRQQH